MSRPLTPLETTVLTLIERGVAKRRIARTLRISRDRVRRIIKRPGQRLVPMGKLHGRDELLSNLYKRFQGNIVLVHRELTRGHAIPVSYPTVHRRVSELNLMDNRRDVSRRFETPPGEEAQSDTSPYVVDMAGTPTHVELYRVILCWSRFEWGRFYLRFRRPDMKRGTFSALESFGGSPEIIVIDNTHLAVLEGTGPDAVIVPEMAEFARAMGFAWLAHERGHADRSGKVERIFAYVEGNFLPDRKFRDLDDLNHQYRVWVDEANERKHGTTGERPIDRLLVEKPRLAPIPKHTVDLSEVVARKVSVEGYVNFETNRYSCPARHVDKTVSVHADDDRVRIFLGGDLIATHERMPCGAGRRVTDPSHHPRMEPRRGETRSALLAELHAKLPQCAEFLAQVLAHHPNHFNMARAGIEELRGRYSPASLERAAQRALRYRAYDLKVLQRILEAQWHRFGGEDEEGK